MMAEEKNVFSQVSPSFSLPFSSFFSLARSLSLFQRQTWWEEKRDSPSIVRDGEDLREGERRNQEEQRERERGTVCPMVPSCDLTSSTGIPKLYWERNATGRHVTVPLSPLLLSSFSLSLNSFVFLSLSSHFQSCSIIIIISNHVMHETSEKFFLLFLPHSFSLSLSHSLRMTKRRRREKERKKKKNDFYIDSLLVSHSDFNFNPNWITVKRSKEIIRKREKEIEEEWSERKEENGSFKKLVTSSQHDVRHSLHYVIDKIGDSQVRWLCYDDEREREREKTERERNGSIEGHPVRDKRPKVVTISWLRVESNP